MADDSPQTLVGISFGDAYRAQEFLTAAQRLASNGRVQLKDAVFVVKKDDGATVVRETLDPQPGRTAISGAVWASLLGLLLGGPVGWLAGGAIGAAGGAAAAKLVDLGIPDDWVSWFRDEVEPGTTTLALLVTDLDRDALVQELERFSGATLVYANLEPYWLDRIRDALGEVAEPRTQPPTNSASSAKKSSSCSSAIPCPPAKVTSRAFDPIPDAISFEPASGHTGSSSPASTIVGQEIRPRSAVKSNVGCKFLAKCSSTLHVDDRSRLHLHHLGHRHRAAAGVQGNAEPGRSRRRSRCWDRSRTSVRLPRRGRRPGARTRRTSPRRPYARSSSRARACPDASGWRVAYAIATIPPNELPMTTGFSMPSTSQNAATSSPHCSSVQRSGSPSSLRPFARWSYATTCPISAYRENFGLK